MPAFWGNKTKDQDTGVSADFQHALMQEVMKTELLRIKALIATTALLCVILTIAYFFASEAVTRVWHGNLTPQYLYSIIGPFILFELWVHGQITATCGRAATCRVYPALYRRADRDVDADGRAGAAHQQHGIGGRARLRRADDLFHLHHPLYAAAGFLALHLHRRRRRRSAVLHGDVLSSGGRRRGRAIFYHAARSLIVLICGVLAGAVGHQLRRQFEASIKAATARDRITNLFGQHVSPQVVERLMAEGTSTDSDIRRVAVMFVDFRSFTAGARTRTPQEVVDRLDGAFAMLVDILDRHGGIVNKFLGDGFLALFGAPLEAPDPAHRAVAAAREMLEANARVNEATSWPLRIGIGIHIGEVVAGNIGSPRRKEYTVIGDTVNFASRLEALNKDFNSQFLISEAVRDALGEACGDAVSLGEVEVRGYERPMAVWRLG